MRHSRGVADTLTAVAATWPAPMAGTPAQNGNSAAGNIDFSRKAEELAQLMWQAPVADDAPDRAKGKINGRGEPKLSGQAMAWPTPKSRDHKGSSPDSVMRADGKSRMDNLDCIAEQGFSRPVPETHQNGPRSLQAIQTSRRLFRSAMSNAPPITLRRWLKAGIWRKQRLNPNFVGWLMGWPTGHALCACSATEFAAWLRQMRGALYRAPMASGPWVWMPPPEAEVYEQISMF